MRQSADKQYTKTVTWNDGNIVAGATLEGDYIDCEKYTYEGKDKIKYVIKDADGVEYGVYGSAVLNRLFANIPVGAHVWIEFKGKGTTSKGNPLNLYSVEFDPEFNN